MPETPEKPGKPELPDFAPIEALFRNLSVAVTKFSKDVAALGYLDRCARTGCGHPRLQHVAGDCAGKNWHCQCLAFVEAEKGSNGE